MTGLGLGARGEEEQPARPAKPAEPTLLKRADGKTPEEAARAERAAGEPAQDAGAHPAQKAQAQEDLAPTRAEEEMLEIPAFLRRQAN